MSKDIRTVGTTIIGTSAVRIVTGYFISHSMWFEVEPLPDDKYRVRWKEGEPLDVLKVRQMADNPEEPVAWWAAVATPQCELIKWGYSGNTAFPFFIQTDAEAQLNFLLDRQEHREDNLYLLHVFANGHIYTEEWPNDDPERPESG